jgi:hypothetical protein
MEMAVRGRVILNSVNSSGCVSTSMEPACNDDIIADREAQPSALTGRLGREECGVPVVTMTSGWRRTKSAAKAGSVSLCPSILDCNVHAFEIAKFAQLLTERVDPMAFQGWRGGTQEAKTIQFSCVLRARRAATRLPHHQARLRILAAGCRLPCDPPVGVMQPRDHIIPSRVALRDFNPAYVGSGSFPVITAPQH